MTRHPFMKTISFAAVLFCFSVSIHAQNEYPYTIVDTNQSIFYEKNNEMSKPEMGEAYYGQDAQYDGNQPSYTLSPDGLTVLDNVTGLTWQQTPDRGGDGDIDAADKLSWTDALEYPNTLNAIHYGGYNDWRLPSIKELYSLILFNGLDPSGVQGNDTSGLTPFMDTDYFDFAYGDTAAGERIIDSQYWSSTAYLTTTMVNDHTVFGVNFADGRIKGYGTQIMGREKTSFVLCVRGNENYGINNFVDNGNGTITDEATGLMWMQNDSGAGCIWQDALAYAEELDFAGYDDWRLPNVKELQSIVDYSRSPETHGTPAIDPVFNCTPMLNEAGEVDYGYYWSGTTHATSNGMGGSASYVSFGRAMGYMNGAWRDVHGAGAQRSDPKMGNPDDYPTGHGPQGDAIRIFNYVRCVRNITKQSNVTQWNLY